MLIIRRPTAAVWLEDKQQNVGARPGAAGAAQCGAGAAGPRGCAAGPGRARGGLPRRACAGRGAVGRGAERLAGPARWCCRPARRTRWGIGQSLQGSISAVSKPMFAGKALCW